MNNEIINPVKPVIKWIGGKTQIIDTLMENFPKEINNYHEIFLGGGSVLLSLLSHIKSGNIKLNGKIFAYDLNDVLIHLYKNIQSNPDGVYTCTKTYADRYNSYQIDKETNRKFNKKENDNSNILSKESYYYHIRNEYNNLTSQEKQSINGTAMFIFLNKTCFRGMFREGPNGFNVPFGNYKSPTIIDQDHINNVSELIKDVVFMHSDFKESFKNIDNCNAEEIEENCSDFVYLDPPYAPENEKSFVGYTIDGFDLEQHTELFKLCNALNELDIKFLMSNSSVDLVRNSFTHKKIKIEEIIAKRSINSKNPDSKTNELLIKNY